MPRNSLRRIRPQAFLPTFNDTPVKPPRRDAGPEWRGKYWVISEGADKHDIYFTDANGRSEKISNRASNAKESSL